MNKCYTYILKCADNTYYTGSTKNLEKRLEEHQSGYGADYTKNRLPVKLVYFEEYDKIDEAFYREKQIQGWSRKKKDALIENNFDKIVNLAKCLNETSHKNKGFDSAQPPAFDSAQPPVLDSVQSSGLDCVKSSNVDFIKKLDFDSAQSSEFDSVQSSEKKQELALEMFGSGYNCAQSVLYSFAKELNIEEELLLKMSNGFGAGMGRKQEVCGAVSGGILVLNFLYGMSDSKDRASQEKTYAKVQELMNSFENKNITVNCKKLLDNCDLLTKEGQEMFVNKKLKERCNNYVVDVVEILEDIISKEVN